MVSTFKLMPDLPRPMPAGQYGRENGSFAEFVEIENGRKTPRPRLQGAIGVAKRARAMLLVAKLDMLTRNVHFLTALLDSGVHFRAVEMPEAEKRMFQLMLVLAEWEAQQASRRQKAALQAAKARGVRFGNPTILAASNTARREAAQSRAEALRPTLEGLRQRGFSQREMVEELNRLIMPAARGGKWSFMPLQRVLKQLGFTGKPTPQHPRVGMSNGQRALSPANLQGGPTRDL